MGRAAAGKAVGPRQQAASGQRRTHSTWYSRPSGLKIVVLCRERGGRREREAPAASARSQGPRAGPIANPHRSPSHSAAPWLLLPLAAATASARRALQRPRQPLEVIWEPVHLSETGGGITEAAEGRSLEK